MKPELMMYDISGDSIDVDISGGNILTKSVVIIYFMTISMVVIFMT